MSNPQLSKKDKDAYVKILKCLSAIADSANHALCTSSGKGEAIANKICELAIYMAETYGCGNLCPDPVHGCMACKPYENIAEGGDHT
jgi:hypothetical protein